MCEGQVQFPITGMDEFVRDKENVTRMNISEVEATKARLPKEPGILVLRYAH